MTNIEIDRRLALAIGYTADRVRKNKYFEIVEVLNNEGLRIEGPIHFDGWQRFDHTDPAVIWPIAERFDAFPLSVPPMGKWRVFPRGSLICATLHKVAATASALAVIAYVESTK